MIFNTIIKPASVKYIIVALLISTFPAVAKKNNNRTELIVRNFVAALSGRDSSQIAALMTVNHIFIDAAGNQVSGRDKMIAEWQGNFKWFPDYSIEITDCFVKGDTAAIFGYAQGHYQGKKTGEYTMRLPASWKVIVQQGKVRQWQVFADTKLPFDIMMRNSEDAITYDATPKARGIGGIFFKCKDPEAVRAWYKKNLHMDTYQYGTNFEWRQGGDPARKGFTLWAPFSDKTKYFAPSAKEFMINYRVTNLEGLLVQLKKDGVTIVDKVETVDYGKFVHILDCEQNKIELWEPVDEVYDKMGEGGGVTK